MIPRRMPENKKRPGGRTSSRAKAVARSVKKPSTADKRTLPAPVAKEAPAAKAPPAVKPTVPVKPTALAKPAVTPRMAVPAVAETAAPARLAPKRALKPTRPPLSILMVAAEAHPYAKTGGLAEVAAALPDALGRLGHRVTLVLPRYRGVDLSGSRSQATSISIGARTQLVSFHAREERPGVTVVFVDVPELFDRAGGLYNVNGVDYPDNAWRFAVFSRAALEYVRLLGQRPSIIHAHDWQAGLVPVYQKMHFSPDPIVGGVPAIFTIHNLAFQGTFPSTTLPALGFGPELMDVQALEYWGQISYLKGGINFSEQLTTVSPTYAREILTPEFGFGFDGVLGRRADALTGILNGIDVDRWNPENDEFIGTSYSRADLSGKSIARRVLLETTGLPADREPRKRPIIGLISRLTVQKGFDLIATIADELMALDAMWVMLGSGDREYEDLWRSLASRYPDRVSATIGFDERLAHQIEAGADMFLMPWQLQHCGLNQMYSLRYGTAPIVRATGGLDDTVKDASEPGGNGFKFSGYSPAAM